MTGVIYLNLCKAFNTALDNILASKLERDELDCMTTLRVRNLLGGHIQRVAVNSSMSRCRPVMSRVPQDSPQGGGMSIIKGLEYLSMKTG